MAKIKSSWYPPPTLQYAATVKERQQKAERYKDWLATVRGWTPEQVAEYLKAQALRTAKSN